MITRRTVWELGFSQFVCWGVFYYLIGGFGDLIVADLGWSPAVVYGGFSAALVVMGLSSALVGKFIDRYGGQPVMVTGSCVGALGCVGVGLAHGLALYYCAWICLGLAMRLTLYEAAFAALARIGGPLAKRPMSQITLLGGLSSTAFWPIGHFLADKLGWRHALFVYAGFALLTVPLHLAIPAGVYREIAESTEAADVLPRQRLTTRRDQLLAGGLYASIAILISFLGSGMSAHMIGIFSGFGLAASMAVGIATLRGIGQSAARLGEVLFGARLPPLELNVVATALLPVCFLVGLGSGNFWLAAAMFAFLYGAGNGVATITRGTMPLLLFDPRSYGSIVGNLLAPSFFVAALAPIVYALILERFGAAATLWFSTGVAVIIFVAAIVLQRRFGVRATSAEQDDG